MNSFRRLIRDWLRRRKARADLKRFVMMIGWKGYTVSKGTVYPQHPLWQKWHDNIVQRGVGGDA